MSQDYWWVTRPKRKLNTIPEELAAFCTVALGKSWKGNRQIQIAYEEELEHSGTKRIGERRDGSGSGGRTHGVMLYSLGLWFEKEEKVFLTLAGEAIMAGENPVPILKKQVLEFQYPSAYSTSIKITPRFTIRPFIFLLRLLSDSRIKILTQEEIAFVIAINAENEGDQCYQNVVEMILKYRSSSSWRIVYGENYLSNHNATANNLKDVANTIMNWLDYTQLVYREKKIIGIDPDKKEEILRLLNNQKPLIKYPIEDDVFQRKYGIDPKHQKDTRNLLNTITVSSREIEKNRILRAFFGYASINPVQNINKTIIDNIHEELGIDSAFIESVLTKTYPNGAINPYLVNYRSMAFRSKDEAIDFEKATTNLFRDIFGYEAIHLGQKGAQSVPDVLLISEEEGYQAIIDNKAYSEYSISGDHHNRMVYNYIKKINDYSKCKYPLAYFVYISGGFVKNIDDQIKKEVMESGVSGSCISVANLISLIEAHIEQPFSHNELRNLFSLNREIHLLDILH